MNIKDLTKEQVIELSKLIHPYPSDIEKEIKQEYIFKYQSEMPSNMDNSEGEVERVELYWKANTFADTIDKVRLTIYANLDCYWSYLRSNGAHSLPTNNQHKIQKKFIQWKLKPKY